MTDRCQLNLRLDGRRDLLETIKDVAAAEGLSVNAWVVRTLESAVTVTDYGSKTVASSAEADIEPVLDKLLDIKLDKLLDTRLDKKLDNFEERLGKLSA
jgi:hypothetical protein